MQLQVKTGQAWHIMACSRQQLAVFGLTSCDAAAFWAMPPVAEAHRGTYVLVVVVLASPHSKPAASQGGTQSSLSHGTSTIGLLPPPLKHGEQSHVALMHVLRSVRRVGLPTAAVRCSAAQAPLRRARACACADGTAATTCALITLHTYPQVRSHSAP